jgi:hypothetical protein
MDTENQSSKEVKSQNIVKNSNKSSIVKKLDESILNIFNLINANEVNIHEKLKELGNNFLEEKKKSSYLNEMNNYINSIVIKKNNQSNNNQSNNEIKKINIFNKFFNEKIKIKFPEKK